MNQVIEKLTLKYSTLNSKFSNLNLIIKLLSQLMFLGIKMYGCYDYNSEDYTLMDKKVLTEAEGCENAGDGFVFANQMSDQPPGCCDCRCCKPLSIKA